MPCRCRVRVDKPTIQPLPMMRIGLITGEYPPMQGGIGAFTQELGRALVESGHSVYVLTDKRVPNCEAQGIHVQGAVRSWNRSSLSQIQQWAKNHQLDVVNIQYEAAAFRMSQLIHFLPRWLGGIPAVTTFHDLLVPYLFPKAGPLRFQAILTLARSSAGVITTNREDERRLIAAQGIQRLRTIPIGSNVAPDLPPDYDRRAWRGNLGIPTDAALVGYFGFMNASKGVDKLLIAVNTLVQDALDVHILLIGGRTGSSDPTNVRYADEIDSLIGRYNLTSRVHWTGFVDELQVSAYLTACDVIALPFQDGVSLRRGSFMAAIAHGCAIVTTTPQGDLPEVQNRVHALLVPPDDPQALALALRELIARPDLRATLAQNARRLAAEFTWDRIAARTAAFFAEIVSS